MSSTSRPARLGLVAASSLLLVLGAGCSASGDQEPSAQSPSAPVASGTPAPGPTATPGKKLPPPATTPVPQPTPGDIHETVASQPQKSVSPVPLDKSSRTGTGLTVKVSGVEAMTAKAKLPGEVSGPALKITVVAENTGTTKVNLNATAVGLYGSDGVPAGEMSAKPARPLDGKLASGKTAKGIYVFTIPKKTRDPVKITVTVNDSPVVVFTGKAP